MSRKGGGIVRGQSKEFLRVEVRAAGTGAAGKCARAQDPVDSTSHGNYFEEQKFRTPSAPPIAGEGDEVMFDAVESAETSGGLERTGLSSVADILAHYVHELPPSSNVHEHGVQMPYVENNLLSQILSFTINVQNAWQSFVAYDACFRLCLNAWARNCMEAPDSFGMSAWCCEVPFVKKICVVPHRPKLQATSSFRNLYMQAGSDYVRQISKVMKSQVTMLTSTLSMSLLEEMFTCTLELQSSCRGHQRESIPPQYLKPGIGESQLLAQLGDTKGTSITPYLYSDLRGVGNEERVNLNYNFRGTVA